MHNTILDEHGNEIAPEDVAVISNLNNRVDLKGTFGLVRVKNPEQAEMRCTVHWTISRRGHFGEELGSSHGKGAGWQPSQRAVQH